MTTHHSVTERSEWQWKRREQPRELRESMNLTTIQMKDIKKILELCNDCGVKLHESYNVKLFKTLVGNDETEDIVFAEIVLVACNIRSANDKAVKYGLVDRRVAFGVIDEDWWEVVQYFRGIAQLFAQVNDVAVSEWNGCLEEVVAKFIEYKVLTDTLEVE